MNASLILDLGTFLGIPRHAFTDGSNDDENGANADDDGDEDGDGR